MSIGSPIITNSSVTVPLSDPICGASSHSFEITTSGPYKNDVYIGLVMCSDSDGASHTSYYSVDPTQAKYTVLPSCTGTVITGVASNVTYRE